MQIRNTIITNAKMEKWAGVMVDGQKLPLIFVEMGLKINSWVYKDMLEAQVVPWLQNTYGNQLYTFMQDDSPAHTAVFVQGFWKIGVSIFLGQVNVALSSPDLNPMNFSMWSILMSRVCRKPHQNTNALKKPLLDEWEDYPKEMVCSACAVVPSCLLHAIKNRGYHCENAWNKMSSKHSD